ncbi:nucleolar and spindle associated protein 1 [Homo sapiens]|uniref:Isoform 5 of Nucleolar and spindle-associated protein 1 n=1 Tax=Homo sapiens TaxID=9606 RepID=Q9BXS6-5|nr:nucleolar and spindle-associated protein 1 isoform 7 [Homo sapiens]EAW92482.1 nucleolar and spindle associated protein 1, isoform CRA_a [Homo sapiens]KAI2573653.1 nucleolar and spindle associated protein 1 [Homo sapiens]KAI4057262.1 nucleolar and spindle associated protein 1 [Homo sapiens]|eukprot:NP_001288065.1 nucleolar and spindle-associated protein 1 isoform 7 [Homo sapiens]
MIIPSLEELDSLKYSDLQNLAKSLGLRANLRATKLLKALKGYIKHEARKGNENQDESQTSASSCDETEIQISNQEEAERQPLGHVTKTRRRCKTVRVDPDSQNHSEIKISNPTEFQNHEKQESQDLRATAKVPSPPDEHQEAENAVSSGNRDSKVPSEGKKSLYTDESSKPGKNKRTAITTPNFKKLHEAHFKEMESIDQYIERKKKHFEEHNSMNELKQQPINKGGVRTPVPPRGRLSVASTPISQRRSQGRSCGPASQSTLGLKGSLKRSAISAAKTGVRFSAATKDNEHKRSLTKTPARKSAHVTVSGGTPKGEAVLGTHKLKTITGNSAAVITPFKLTTEATQTPVSNKKPVFDLKASLSRPLNYEPHKGKLKPWGQSKENNYLNQHVNRINFYKKTYKQPHLQTKEEQRKKREQERKEKKAKVLGMRRGLILAED